MNGRHLRSLPSEELTKLIGERWKDADIIKEPEGPFINIHLDKKTAACGRGLCAGDRGSSVCFRIQDAVKLLKDWIDLITDADKVLSNLLANTLPDSLSREKWHRRPAL